MLTDNLKKAPFRKGDVIIYLILTVVVVALFLTAGQGKKQSRGFSVELAGKTVMTGSFSDGSFVIIDGEAVKKVGENLFKITSEKGYNVILVDWQTKNITVTETDCGTSKECMYMNLNYGDIICAPHQLLIRATGVEPVPIVG